MAAKGEGFEVKKKKQPCFDRGKVFLEAFLVLQRRSCIVSPKVEKIEGNGGRLKRGKKKTG